MNRNRILTTLITMQNVVNDLKERPNEAYSYFNYTTHYAKCSE